MTSMVCGSSLIQWVLCTLVLRGLLIGKSSTGSSMASEKFNIICRALTIIYPVSPGIVLVFS